MSKIALVANTTWNIFNFRLNVIRRLLSDGHEVIVFAPVDEYISYLWKMQGVTHVPLHRLKRDSINPVRDMLLTSELLGLYRKYRPDIIVHYTVKPNIFGGIAARIASIPSIAVVTGLGYAFIHNGLVKRTTKSLYRIVSRYHRRMVFENQDDRQLFIDERLMTPAKGVTVKGCGVDLQYYAPVTPNGGHEGRTTFTFIGRLLYDKGIEEFIQAAHIVKQKNADARFWIVGEIDRDNPSAIREEDLLRWVDMKTVEYFGATGDVRPYIRQSDCIVLPSYREGMSRVIMEAMAMERPVITTDTAGCREAVVHMENGLLTPVRDVHALADAMLRFHEMPSGAKRAMGARGRAMAVELFDDKQVAEVICGLVLEELEKSKFNIQ